MSAPLGLLARLAARRIPAAYRDDILADLQDRHRGAVSLAFAILRSAHDARRHIGETRTEKTGWWSGWGADLRFAARQQWARPGHAVAIVLVLAIAVGLNTAVFSMVRAVLLRPVAFADPARVVFVWSTNNHGQREPMSPARAIDLRDRSGAFSGGALIGHLSMTLTGDGPPEQWPGASVSPSFFDVLGTPAAVGRTFTAADTIDAVVLSDLLWSQRWHRDRSIIGRAIVLNGTPRVIVGVMPPEFYWPSITPETSALNPPLSWTKTLHGEAPERPQAYDGDPDRDRVTGYARLVARVRPGVSIDAAEAATRETASALAREFPATDSAQSAVLIQAREQLFGPIERPMLFIWLASAIVVFGACLNVGTLLLVKQTARRQEFAVRSALGADRARLVRQLLSETTLLALAGGVLGVVLAKAALGVLVAAAPENVGRLDQVAIDGVVLAGALALSIAAGLLLGALSAVALWRDRTATDLRTAGAAGGGHTRLRRGLVAAEVCVAMVLLVGTALFGKSLMRLQQVDVGFNTQHLLTFDLALGPAARGDGPRQVAFFDRVLERLRAVPGVRHAGAAVTLPIGGDDFGGQMYPEGRPLPAAGTAPRLGFQVVQPGWFETLGVRVVDGRDFTASDHGDTPLVVMVNTTLAAQLWPGQRPIGQRVRLSRAATSASRVVVGVVADVHHEGPARPARPEYYLPFAQQPFSFMAVALRTDIDPASLTAAVRAAIAEIDPTVPAANVTTMDAHLTRTYARARFLSSLTVLFGVLSLVLALIGVYGVTSFSVAQRSREFGVRTALGASRLRLVRNVVTESMTPVGAGIVGGLAGAYAASRAVSALLFDTAPLDPSAYAAAIGVLLMTALCATAIPARRAASIDPVTALRDS